MAWFSNLNCTITVLPSEDALNVMEDGSGLLYTQFVGSWSTTYPSGTAILQT